MSATISVDLGVCSGYACCMMEAPELFDIDDDTDKAVVLVEEIDDAQLARARAAEQACPSRAITVTASAAVDD